MKRGHGDTNSGDISVDNNVIKGIALKAATDIDGMHEIKRGYLGRLWNSVSRRNSAQGVKLDFSNEGEVSITLKLSVDYGTNIARAAGEAQENVKKAVEQMTGLAVAEVAVTITGMQPKK